MAKFDTLTDPFNNSSFDSGLWAQAGLGTVNETTSLNMTPNTGYSAIQVYSNANYDLTGSYAYIKITTSANQYDNFLTLEDSIFSSANGFTWRVDKDAGNIYATKQVAGVTSDVASATYSASTYTWVKIRESGGNIYWDYATAAAPTSWVNFTSIVNAITITALYANFKAIPNGSFGTTQLNNFNVAGTSTASNNWYKSDG